MSRDDLNSSLFVSIHRDRYHGVSPLLSACRASLGCCSCSRQGQTMRMCPPVWVLPRRVSCIAVLRRERCTPVLSSAFDLFAFSAASLCPPESCEHLVYVSRSTTLAEGALADLITSQP